MYVGNREIISSPRAILTLTAWTPSGDGYHIDVQCPGEYAGRAGAWVYDIGDYTVASDESYPDEVQAAVTRLAAVDWHASRPEKLEQYYEDGRRQWGWTQYTGDEAISQAHADRAAAIAAAKADPVAMRLVSLAMDLVRQHDHPTPTVCRLLAD